MGAGLRCRLMRGVVGERRRALVSAVQGGVVRSSMCEALARAREPAMMHVAPRHHEHARWRGHATICVSTCGSGSTLCFAGPRARLGACHRAWSRRCCKSPPSTYTHAELTTSREERCCLASGCSIGEHARQRVRELIRTLLSVPQGIDAVVARGFCH